MSKGERLQRILNEAEGKEKKYDWLEAAELYGQALGLAGPRDFLRKGETQENIGYCFRRAAMQAESREEFRERVQRAVAEYEKARGFYERLTIAQKAARTLRCTAVSKYLSHWFASGPPEKRKLLDESLDLEDKALQSFSESGEMLEYGRTYSALPHVFWQREVLEWSRQARKRICGRGVEWGEKAVAALSEVEAVHELAKAYFTLFTCQIDMVSFISDLEKQEGAFRKALEYAQKAADLSERTNNALFLGLSNIFLRGKPEERRKKADEALRCGEKTRDNRLIAWSLCKLADTTFKKAYAEEDPAKWKELMEETFQFYDRAHRLYSSMPIMLGPRGNMDFPYGWIAYYFLAAERESVIERRLGFFKKAEEAGAEALRLAEASNSPDYTEVTLAFLSAAQGMRAQTDSDPAEKKHRLENVVKSKERVCQIREETTRPFHPHARGVALTRLATFKMHLADVEQDIEAKQRLLEEAASSMEKGLKLCEKWALFAERMGWMEVITWLRRDQDCYAKLLTRLHRLTNKPEHLRRAVEILQKAIESSDKLDMVSHTAESHWKIAKAQDLLGDHMKAAESFQHASQSYKKAAEKIPQLKNLYQDHASYMQAWNEIEKARHHNAQGEFGRAKEHYEKAVDLHKSTERWNYLTPNYAAWASVDEAEELSRKGQAEKARALFEQAAKQFAEAKVSIEAKLGTIEAADEKEIATQLTKASENRRDYCLGRTQLEEAKILDMQGDHGASARSYGVAAERFRKVADATERESDRRELRPLVDLCRAWQTMTRAEAEASPDLYLEAARLFDEAKEHSLSEKARVLALGHSSFCKALEAGARFEATRDMTVYSASKRHMEAAENFYLKAGFKTASEYAKATLLLSDAYMYMHKAETTSDPRERTQYYQMAEKLLQASAGSYMQAKHPEKRDQVQRLLEGAKEKRQLAMSLAEVLHAPTITATTTSLSTPTPTHEQAVGLERFEYADVQANLILKVKDVRVGEDIGLAIELVNAGKAPALLIKVDEVTPEGFEIREVPETYTFEDSYINLKGKRLNPLKTEDVKVVVTPRSKGTHTIKPRILYLDETGKYKSHEPEPVTITVKELGISGWIKGEK